MRKTLRNLPTVCSVLASILLASCALQDDPQQSPGTAVGAQPESAIPDAAEQARIAHIDPEDAFAQATAAYRAGDFERAALQFRDAALASGNANAWVNLGVALTQAGRNDDALAALQRATELAPERAEAWVQRGLVERRAGALADAEKSYKQALAVDPNQALAWRNLGVLYEVYLGRRGEAVAAYQKCQAALTVPDPEVATWIRSIEAQQVAVMKP